VLPEGFLIKDDEVCGLVEHMGKIRITCNILARKPEGKCPHSRPGDKWWSDIKWIVMD
jgi:hypothetical protein